MAPIVMASISGPARLSDDFTPVDRHVIIYFACQMKFRDYGQAAAKMIRSILYVDIEVLAADDTGVCTGAFNPEGRPRLVTPNQITQEFTNMAMLVSPFHWAFRYWNGFFNYYRDEDYMDAGRDLKEWRAPEPEYMEALRLATDRWVKGAGDKNNGVQWYKTYRNAEVGELREKYRHWKIHQFDKDVPGWIIYTVRPSKRYFDD
ncbi:MAG: hypothetical protein Q9170_002036 [Blastenia crenularia]